MRARTRLRGPRARGAAMALAALLALPGRPAAAQAPSTRGTGVFADVALRELVATNQVLADEPIAEDQIQPASIDLRLGRYAYRVRASFLPGDRTVMDKLGSFLTKAKEVYSATKPAVSAFKGALPEGSVKSALGAVGYGRAGGGGPAGAGAGAAAGGRKSLSARLM